MKSSRISLLAIAFSAVTLLPTAAQAQAINLGADLMSRYVWRGYDFGESFSIQPTLEFASGPVAVGSWASYSIAADGSVANEHDLYLSVSAGPVSFGLTDYYFPGGIVAIDATGVMGVGAPADAGFFNFDGDGEGAHWIEPFVSYSGPASFPISLYGAMMLHNDPDNSVYLEAAYPFAIDGVDLSVTAGAVPMESAFYGTDGFALVNLALSASRAVPITDSFSLPVSVSYILNPELERTYLVFGLSF